MIHINNVSIQAGQVIVQGTVTNDANSREILISAIDGIFKSKGAVYSPYNIAKELDLCLGRLYDGKETNFSVVSQ